GPTPISGGSASGGGGRGGKMAGRGQPLPPPGDGGGLDRNPRRRPGKKKSNRPRLGAPRRERLGTNTLETGAKPPVQRTDSLPFQAIGWEAVGMPLADALGPEALAGAFLVTLRTGDIELALLLVIARTAWFEERSRQPIDGNVHR